MFYLFGALGTPEAKWRPGFNTLGPKGRRVFRGGNLQANNLQANNLQANKQKKQLKNKQIKKI